MANLFIYYFAQIFTSPIIELGRAAASLGQGNMRTRVRKGTILLRDEIADLKDIFNSMAQQIASHQLILEHKVLNVLLRALLRVPVSSEYILI